MNQPRPILTVLCFTLFAAEFASSNVDSAAQYCSPLCCGEPAPLKQLADDMRCLLHEAGLPPRAVSTLTGAALVKWLKPIVRDALAVDGRNFQ